MEKTKRKNIDMPEVYAGRYRRWRAYALVLLLLINVNLSIANNLLVTYYARLTHCTNCSGGG